MSLPANAFELHCHTSEVSSCGKDPAEAVVRRCVELGYAGMVVTDHISRDRAVRKGIADLPWPEQVQHWLRGYYAAKAAAPVGFHVFPGAEFTLEESDNDYLVYGMEEDFLLHHEGIDTLALPEFSKTIRAAGLLLAQAHPFRTDMRIVKPNLLDGMEVYNGNANHESCNGIAAQWAQRWALLPLSGSDYHGGDSGAGRAPGGVVFRRPVQTPGALLAALRAGEYSLLKE
ncbi:MAG: PHP domain-containing protein [Oscillospiraceae bacterium]|jgi:predicted metal-dependent phosphoesterase TrpH|nr:PHP domain-containing protein [Oscillospiraceae bacterium]